MKNTKIGKKLMALVLVLATMVAFAATAFAYDVDSDPRYIDNCSYNGVSFRYKVLSTLYVDGPRSFRGSIWVSIPSQLYVPAKWMKVRAEIIDKTTGKVVLETSMEENTSSSYYMYVVTKPYGTSNPVCSRGEYTVYNGTTYIPGLAYETKTEGGTRAISETLLSTLDVDGNYPKTSTGETYGSALLADVVGYKPDLISAQGINGISGYVRHEDLNPVIHTEADYENYKITLEANEWKIPLYDLQGNVIGNFEISKGEVIPGVSDMSYEEARAYAEEAFTAVPEKTRLSYEEARAYFEGKTSMAKVIYHVQDKPEVPDGAVAALIDAPIEKWLVNGEYPRTADGKTYGPKELLEVLGEKPDLILTQGNHGKIGFVMLEDDDPTYYCKTPEEVNTYLKAHPVAGDRTVPVYDLEGDIIDEYTYYKGEVYFG